MRITTKIVGVAAATALIAGAGLAAAPAQAKTTSKVAGSTGITVPIDLITAAAGAGVTVAPIAPATASAISGAVILGFPVARPTEDGVLPHKGGFSLSTSAMTLTVSQPSITYATSGATTAQISGIVGGIPDGNPFAGLNGKPATLFDVSNFVIKNTVSKVTGKGKSWKRVYTQTMTGDVKVVNNQAVVDIVNGLLGVPLFQPGMDFGSLNTKWTNTKTCTTKKECAA